jgi:hypothetical protein
MAGGKKMKTFDLLERMPHKAVSHLFGGGAQKEAARQAEKARKQQERLLAAQQAQQLRDQQKADDQEADIDGDLAAQRRAVAARRRGKSALEYVGPTVGLKDKLGG